MQQDEPITSESVSEKKGGEILETVRFIILSLAIVFAIRYFVAQPFIVSGDSMVPTFENGEYLIVDQLTYRFDEPNRGDVIIMRYPLDTKKYFIKRVVGLPGESISIEGTVITVTLKNGESIILSEPYVANQKNESMQITLTEKEYFVLGDNRPASSDSRRWGPLPKEDIVGRPLLRLFPFTHLSWLPGITKD